MNSTDFAAEIKQWKDRAAIEARRHLEHSQKYDKIIAKKDAEIARLEGEIDVILTDRASIIAVAFAAVKYESREVAMEQIERLLAIAAADASLPTDEVYAAINVRAALTREEAQ